MNYQRIYNELIINRQNNPLPKEIYTEKHHIIPKSLGGSNNKSNIVALSAREHFIAHWLLAKIYGGKMWSAFFLMCRSSSSSAKGISAKSYVYSNARENFSAFISGSAHHKFNATKINFFNIKTKKKEYCTQNELRKKYNLKRSAISEIVNGRKKSYKGWINTDKAGVEEINKLRNKKIFSFVNSEGYIFTGTQYELLQFDTSLHPGNVSNLCNKKRKTHKGWRLLC